MVDSYVRPVNSVFLSERLHFNVPRVIVEHSMKRWGVGTGDWPATLDFALNILACFIDDSACWLLHVRFADEFLRDVSEYQVEPGRWRIRGSEIKAWLVLQAFGTGMSYGEPTRVYA
jgi:hypothetical protein